MNKAIILLSGTPSGKSKFIETAKNSSWLWNINPRDFLGAKSNSFYWDGERTDEYYKFSNELLKLVNKYFEFEEKYLKEKIEKFQSDYSETKTNKEKVFNKFLLIAHGISKDIVPMLKNEYGVFEIHVTRHDLNTNVELHELILYEDDANFESEVERYINVLTNSKGKE